MKKQVLIVASSLVMGGLEKALISLCDNIDYSKYDVDLYLFNEGRNLLPLLNGNVRVLPDSPYYALVYNRSLSVSVKELFKQRQYYLGVYRVFRTIRAKMHLRLDTLHDWKVMKRTMLKIEKRYDAAIGFEEGTADYYVAECVNAHTKSCWILTDISKIGTNRNLDRTAFSEADYICTVSDNAKRSIINLFPAYEAKVKVFSLPSLYDTDRLFSFAEESAEFDADYFNIVSIGRLVELKGFQFCVEACRKLIDAGYKVRWYVAGEGDYRNHLEQLIRKLMLRDSFILLGNCDNPYKYINAADLCVQASSYEGYGLVVYEEKLLQKPIVLSNIPSFAELIDSGKNGLIVERDSDSIFRAVKSLIDDSDLRNRLAITPINGFVTKRETINNMEWLFTASSNS